MLKKSVVKSQEITQTALIVWGGIALVAVGSFLLQQKFQQRALIQKISQGGSAANMTATELKKNYQDEYLKIVGNLLKSSRSDSAEVSVQAAAAKNQLLALMVPAEFKDSHLSSVMALTDLEQAIAEQNETAVVAWRQLEEIFNNINSQL